MQKFLHVMGTAALLALAGCGDKAADEGGTAGAIADTGKPVQRQPGSWSTKMEIIKLEGPDIKAGERDQMQAMMNMMGSVSICLTPEAVAREDITKNLEGMSNQGGECQFDKKDIRGNRVSFAATCKTKDGGGAKITAEGKNDATSQDITISTRGTKPDGSAAGEMVMRITGTRTGECKPGDITPPMPGSAPGQAKGDATS